MALNSSWYQQLLMPHQGYTRQASSWGRDPERGGTWLGLRPKRALLKRVFIAPGETHQLAHLTGAGIITGMWMTTMLPMNPHAMRSLVLRCYWDGEAQPSVECPFGDFFGMPFGRYVSYIAEPMSATSGGLNCLWPMPYAEGARVEITNEASRPIDPLYYRVIYTELDEPLETPLRFHAQWLRDNPTQRGVPFTLLEARGQGHYVGCHLFMQNLEWWLRWPPGQIILPYGFGLGMLEGWESIYIDDETTPSVIGTGTEDYFGGSFYYYQQHRFSGPYHGCTLRDYVRGQIAAYRFEVLSPVSFQRALRVMIDHGFNNELKCDYTRVTYWYQTEPHAPFPPLPDVSQRQPSAPLVHMVQAALALGTPVAAGLGLLLGLRRRR